MKFNKNQTVVLWIGISLFFLAVMFPAKVYTIDDGSIMGGSVLYSKRVFYTHDGDMLWFRFFVELFLITIVVGGLLLSFKPKSA